MVYKTKIAPEPDAVDSENSFSDDDSILGAKEKKQTNKVAPIPVKK